LNNSPAWVIVQDILVQHLSELAHHRQPRRQVLEREFDALGDSHHAPTLALLQAAEVRAIEHRLVRDVAHIAQLEPQDLGRGRVGVALHVLEEHDRRIRLGQDRQRRVHEVPNLLMVFHFG